MTDKSTIAKYPKSTTIRLVSASSTSLDKEKLFLREKNFELSLASGTRTRVRPTVERKKMKNFLSIEKNRPSPNPTNYTYSCSARRDQSNGITFRQFGDGRLFSKILLSIETQSQLPPGEEPAVSGLSRRPSPNTLKVPPFDSS